MQQEQQVVGNKMRPVRCIDDVTPEGLKLLLAFIDARLQDNAPFDTLPAVRTAYAALRGVLLPIAETAEAAPQGWREQITIEAHY